MRSSYYITTPIYYVNDKPHLGHAYTTIAADILARFWRLQGYDVIFVTGTDEHGHKIANAARDAHMTPQDYVDTVSQTFQKMTHAVGACPDITIRTTQIQHKQAAQALWSELFTTNQIYQGTYCGWYAVRDEAYYHEKDIINGCAPTGAPVTWIEEPCYFFRLSQWQEPLLKFYSDHPDFIGPPTRFKEVVRFVEQGLEDLCISRSTFQWGIPVPNNPQHVIYVWLDALTNYITALGYPNIQSDHFQRFWSQSLHIVGKDILRFHGIYWPAFLMAAGLSPPRQLYAHGWWTNDGKKISKSLGNTIDPYEIMNTFNQDAFRYFLIREIPFGADGDFSISALENRINHDLANDWGNLIQRVLVFIQKYTQGQIPQPGPWQDADQPLLNWVKELPQTLLAIMTKQALHLYVQHLWSGIGQLNQYIDHMAPWNLRKNPETWERMHTVLYMSLEMIRAIALFLQPVMPEKTGHILDFLALKPDERQFENLKQTLKPGVSLPPPFHLFPHTL